MRKTLLGLLLTLVLTFPTLTYPGAPSDTVKEHVSKVLAALRDPALKGEPGKKVKEEKVRSVSEEIFDFTELSKRALGQNWKRLNLNVARKI